MSSRETVYKCDKCNRLSFQFQIPPRGNSKGCHCPPFTKGQYYEVIA